MASVTLERATRCGACGTPLTEDGLVDLASLEAATHDHVTLRALREERADLERRLVRAKDELKRAERLSNEPGRVSAAHSIERKERRLAEVDRLLADKPVAEAPAEGLCAVCKTPFRNGHVDRAAAAQAISAQEARRAEVAALERELVSVRVAAANEERLAETAKANEKRVEAKTHRDRARQATKRIPLIEAAIGRAKKG